MKEEEELPTGKARMFDSEVLLFKIYLAVIKALKSKAFVKLFIKIYLDLCLIFNFTAFLNFGFFLKVKICIKIIIHNALLIYYYKKLTSRAPILKLELCT